MKTHICIIGAGPAGLMAAIGAGVHGATATVIEANEAAGRKLLVTGGGRCNFTHDLTINEFVAAFGKTGRFLRHSLHEFSPVGARAFFEDRGIPSVVEPDGCVFPTKHRAGDLRDVLVEEARGFGATLICGQRVQTVARNDDGFVVQSQRYSIQGRRLIIATGGLSWPQTGSTGDGYRFAQTLGHEITQPRPSLVPLIVQQRWIGKLAGVSVSDVKLTTTSVEGRKVQASGAMVLTQDGIGGPAGQDLSRFITAQINSKDDGVDIQVDLCPDIDRTTLDQQIREQFTAHPKKGLANVLAGLVPKRLALALCRRVRCAEDLQAGQVTKETRKHLLTLLKALPLRVIGTRPIAEATVTQGGVATSQIRRQTMESKTCPGLHFAGEVIDIDGPCGGYHLQMCFSTGVLAGKAAAKSLTAAP